MLAEGNPEAHRRTLTCIPALDGKPYAFDADGNLWRTYPFIERARGYDEIECDEQAYQAAKAFGAFQNTHRQSIRRAAARDDPGLPPHARSASKRSKRRSRNDTAGRADSVQAEIAFARARAADCPRITDLIASGEIPERVTHNDTKLNNVLLDETTAEGICVIDLDTTMPGSALYDFGDMVRTAAPTTREDDADLNRIGVRLDRFEALVKGYLSTATFLNEAELAHLAFSGKLITLECGIRFLTDYLDGDTYFKTKPPRPQSRPLPQPVRLCRRAGGKHGGDGGNRRPRLTCSRLVSARSHPAPAPAGPRDQQLEILIVHRNLAAEGRPFAVACHGVEERDDLRNPVDRPHFHVAMAAFRIQGAGGSHTLDKKFLI